MSSTAPLPGYSLIDRLLDEQRSLSAVERFSRAHDRHEIPAMARHYRDLIPLSAPGPGEQYAFEVDLDACSGCKACVTACHSRNGLDEHETWRDVGLLIGGPERQPLQQTVTTACHHCVEPGCASGCPTLAYDKDAATGIVRHLDDQCIGCQYCLWKCPYEVPKYSAARGIVRKCDMCYGRLTAGEAPACVQACPNGAIAIRILRAADAAACFDNTGEAAEASRPWLPDSPAPHFTKPTTRYLTAQKWPSNTRAGDHFKIVPQPPHWPLVALLLLTQAAVGVLAGDLADRWADRPGQPLPPLLALILTAAGLVASVCHLGRPGQGWRALLGWRRSWLSREVLALGMFTGVTTLSAWANWRHTLWSPTAELTLAALSVTTGLFAVFCSAMVYADTPREFWCLRHTAGRFFGTVAVLGAAILFALSSLAGRSDIALKSPAIALSLATAIKLALEIRFLRNVEAGPNEPALSPLQRSALLLRQHVGPRARARVAFAVLGGLLLPALWLMGAAGVWIPATALGLCLAAELIERHLFFVAAIPAKMPGGL
ncbi:MAG TPA: DmsC/YnfH family molybdoenzyme membrane anchor subunit [Methylomirabilota bacterium]|nr:DmsC/YnfH family molybdoenzyme membrane anchor subunit [Methylomirabilota bacterium]